MTKSVLPQRHRLFLVEDHPFLRQTLVETLGSEPDFSVCGAVGTANEALEAVAKLLPDIVVTDLNLPGKGGLALITDLAALRPRMPVIVFSMHDAGLHAGRCLQAGARAYVMKTDGGRNLMAAIRKALADGDISTGK